MLFNCNRGLNYIVGLCNIGKKTCYPYSDVLLLGKKYFD